MLFLFKAKELNGTEDINTNVCMPFKLEGQHDILRQIDDETCNLLDAAKSIIGAENLNDYNGKNCTLIEICFVTIYCRLLHYLFILLAWGRVSSQRN